MKSPRTLLFLLTLALPAGAQTTWYVDGVHGSDLNAGTSQGAAFQTITHALSVVQASDTIQVASAIYSATNGEVFPLTVPGGVELLGADPRTCIIDGEWPGSAYSGHLVQMESSSRIAGFTLRNGVDGGTSWWSAGLRLRDPANALLHDVMVERCIIDSVARGIRVGGGATTVQNLTIRNVFVVRSSSDAFSLWSNPQGGSSGNAIYNNTVIGGVPGHVTRSALVFSDAFTADVYNNNFYGFDFCGLEAGPLCTLNAWNNNYYLHTGSFGGTYCVDSAATYSQSNDSANNPDFVSTSGDPHLKYYSQCIDAGAGVGSTVDIDGNDLQGSAIDQGCDEHVQDFLHSDVYLWPVIAAGESSTITNIGEGANGVVLFASAQLSPAGPLNLGAVGILYLDPLQMFALMGGTMNRSGLVQQTLTIPLDPSILGLPLYLQGLHYTPTLQQLGLTDLESFRIGR